MLKMQYNTILKEIASGAGSELGEIQSAAIYSNKEECPKCGSLLADS
jgi:hypothetical protein